MQENPFRPAFGVMPPEIIGRRRQIENFIEALELGIGHPHRSTIFVGARGMGKTVILSEIAREAMVAGWITAQVTANPEMLDDILDQINTKAAHLIETGRISLTGISAAGFGVNFSLTDSEPLGWRQKITNKISELDKYGTGVLFLVDEVHADEPNIKTFLTAYQHLIMEERKVAIALAGLPRAVSDLLNVNVITFLRRAHREQLDAIAMSATAKGLSNTFADFGRILEGEALDIAAAATDGYPYLIQMTGFQIWEQSEADTVTREDALRGAAIARESLANAVHETSLIGLSAMDKKFLAAMAKDDGPSKMKDLADRLEKGVGYVGQYRRRLIEAGIIEEYSFGYIDFAIPFMRDYIRTHPYI
jgi:Holliday junction resolvasome RuvABC ATP-dependent DNA helicase subunit